MSTQPWPTLSGYYWAPSVRGIVLTDGTSQTSLGPRGMDKMIQNGKGHTLITNDGHTILKDMAVMHPAAKMVYISSSRRLGVELPVAFY